MKIAIIAMFLNLFLLTTPQAAILILNTNGTYTPIATLSEASTSLDASGKTVLITTPQIITTAITWPDDRELKFGENGVITFNGAGALTGLKKSNPRWFGAKGDDATDDTAAINNSLKALSSGGKLIIPKGIYRVSGRSGGDFCVTVPFDNILIEGDGATSIIKTTANKDVPIYMTDKNNITITKIKIQGTGIYEYFALAKGIGLMIAGTTTNITIEDNDVIDMSMIGIGTAATSAGYINFKGNRVHNCKYTGLNFNGIAYQSFITNNIVSGTTGSVNSAAIQATSNISIIGNSVYNSTGPGIMWGELNGTSVGIVANNIVKDCASDGILAAFTGPGTITGNTVISCSGSGGIVLQGGVITGLTQPIENMIVSNNILFDNFPYQIYTTANGSIISGNQLYTNLTPVQIAASGAAFITVKDPQGGIVLQSDNNVVYGNYIKQGTVKYGIISMDMNTTNFIYGNNLTDSNYVFMDSATFIPMVQLQSYSKTDIRTESFGIAATSYALFPLGSVIHYAPVVGSTLGKISTNKKDTTMRVTASTGATTLEVIATGYGNSDSMLAGDLINIRLDNGILHITTVASVTDADTLVISDAIPSSRSATLGSGVWSNRLVSLPAL